MSTKQNQRHIPASFLQSGKPLPITSKIAFRHPTLQDVLELDQEHGGFYSEALYYAMVNVFLTDPYLYMVYLDDRGLDYEAVTPFDLFILLYQDYEEKLHQASAHKKAPLSPDAEPETVQQQDIYRQAFHFFFNVDKFYLTEFPGNEKVFYCKDGSFLMDAEVFSYVYAFIRQINGIPDPEKIDPADEFAKRLLIEDEREALKKQMIQSADEDPDQEEPGQGRLGTLISAATWACGGGITPFNRSSLHMYDLIDCVRRTDKLLDYKHTMTGLYSGCLDKKQLNFDKLHWSS